MNFATHILAAAERFPGKTALELASAEAPQSLTYERVRQESTAWARWLRSAGIGPGDRCAILADNSPAWVTAYLGTLWIGAVAVPLDTAYKAAQVRTILESSGARFLFTTPKYADIAAAAVQEMAAAPCLVPLDATKRGPSDDSPLAVVPVEPQAAATILYTSGTTSDPKGVVLTHANLDAERVAVLDVVRANETDVVLGVLPLFHALAQVANLLLPLTLGARVVYLESVSSTTLLEALQTRGVTIFACVPQFFYLIHERVSAELAKAGGVRRAIARSVLAINIRLRDAIGWNPGRFVFAKAHHALGPSMRWLVTGGSRFDPAIGRDLYGMGFTLLNAYGLTETTGGATIQRPGDRFTSSVGRAMKGVEIKTLPGTAEISGEILIRGSIIMREYFNRPDATSEALVDGWLHTGDLGYLDADGRLYITGRQKEIIVLSSGKNLYPEEIEAHYRQNPFIKELCVLGLSRPGEPSAERLHALIVPDADAMRARGAVNFRELIRFEVEGLSVQLPAHKRILSYDISVEPLPRTTTGKLKRPEIERLVQARRSDAENEATRPLSPEETAWLADPAHAARSTLMAIIATRFPRVRVRPDSSLELDLGLDSMERVELLTTLERRQGTRVTSAVRASIFSVRQLVDAVIAAPSIAKGALDEDDVLPWESLLAHSSDPGLAARLARWSWFRTIVWFVFLKTSLVFLRLGVGVKIKGLSNVPSRGPYILCPNHQNYVDPFVLCALLPMGVMHQLFLVGAAERFQTPALARFARFANIMPVDPDAHLVQAMQAAATGLRAGRALILFPEGERSIDGEPIAFRKGAAILASHLDVPIVPVALDGLFEIWPRGQSLNWRLLLPWNSKPIKMAFGEPFRVPKGAYSEGTRDLKRRVEEMLATLRAQ